MQTFQRKNPFRTLLYRIPNYSLISDFHAVVIYKVRLRLLNCPLMYLCIHLCM